MRSYCALVAAASGRLRSCFAAEAQGDAGVLGGVRGGEEAGVVAVLHVFAVGLEHARIGAGLGKDFAQHREIEPERVAEAEAFGESGGVDVHHHVDERLDLRRLAGAADVAQRRRSASRRIGFSLFENALRRRRTSDRACPRAPA